MNRNLLISMIALAATYSCMLGAILLYTYAIRVNGLAAGFLGVALLVIGLPLFSTMGAYYFSLCRNRNRKGYEG